MRYLYSHGEAIALAMALLFAVAGLVQVTGPGLVRRAYGRWGYSSREYRITGALELLVAGLLLSSSTRTAGLVLAAIVNFVAVVLLLGHRAYVIAVPGFLIAAAVLVAFVQSR